MRHVDHHHLISILVVDIWCLLQAACNQKLLPASNNLRHCALSEPLKNNICTLSTTIVLLTRFQERKVWLSIQVNIAFQNCKNLRQFKRAKKTTIRLQKQATCGEAQLDSERVVGAEAAYDPARRRGTGRQTTPETPAAAAAERNQRMLRKLLHRWLRQCSSSSSWWCGPRNGPVSAGTTSFLCFNESRLA